MRASISATVSSFDKPPTPAYAHSHTLETNKRASNRCCHHTRDTRHATRDTQHATRDTRHCIELRTRFDGAGFALQLLELGTQCLYFGLERRG